MSRSNHESDNHKFSENYLIEKEKQKTARARNMYMFFGIIIIASLVALFNMVGDGGKGGIDVDMTQGTFKFTVDKPVVEQVHTERKTYNTPEGRSIDFTTGTISQNVLTDFDNQSNSFSPGRFVGENLINQEAGYVVSSTNPSRWNIQYNPAGLSDPLTPINTFSISDGSHMNINREYSYVSSIQDYVTASIGTLISLGVIVDYPNVSYADNNMTAFLTFTNLATNGQSFMKVVKRDSYFYIATANYNLAITSYDVQEELIGMVADFTLFETGSLL